jgi:hypothetical protein
MSAPGDTAPTSAAPSFGGWRLSALLYLVGFLALFLGERLVGGVANTRWILDGVGAALILTSLGLQFKDYGDAEGTQKAARKTPLLYSALGLASLAVYALGIDAVVTALAFADEETEQRYRVIVSAIWPIVFLAGTLPMLASDRVLAASPVLVVPARVSDSAMGALGLAFALALLFPLNFLGAETNERWDFGYFKTARPGTSTLNMVEGLDEPIAATLFFPIASDVTDELRTYFGALEGEKFTVEYADHALEPELAKELKVRDNGYIAFVRGEGDDQQVERIKIGKDFESARRKLKKLDGEVREVLFKIARGKRVAYFTTGHGELYWGAGEPVAHKTGTLRKILKALNYKVEELTLADGSAVEVPEDASVVFILGPESDFLPEELKALDAYRRNGGSLLIGLEPGGPDMSALLDPIGVKFLGDITLANDSKFVPAAYRPIDRANVITNKYSTHPSVTTLSRNSQTMVFIQSVAGALEEVKGDGKTTVVMRSLEDTWGDLDGNFAFDGDTEKRKSWSVAMAASGAAAVTPVAGGDEDPAEWRVVVVSDASWASDLALPPDPNKANFQFVLDVGSWLGQDESIAGTVNSEEDVKIQHAKEDQGWIFSATSGLIPLGLLVLGLVRLRVRRKRSVA